MKDTNIVKDNIKEMIINFDPKHKFVKFGNVVLISQGKDFGSISLIDIRYIDDELYGATNFGYMYLLDDLITDVNDWYNLEDIVMDIISSVKCFN